MIFHGKARILGDNVPNDGGLAPVRFVKDQIYDTAILAKHCMEEIDPSWVQRVEPGDIVVAGKRFASGNTHIQGFLALKGLGVACVVESIPRGAFRAAINAGVAILPKCPGVSVAFSEGDEISVNFGKGIVYNLTRSQEYQYSPMSEPVLEIVRSGGLFNYLKEIIRKQPDRFKGRLINSVSK